MFSRGVLQSLGKMVALPQDTCYIKSYHHHETSGEKRKATWLQSATSPTGRDSNAGTLALKAKGQVRLVVSPIISTNGFQEKRRGA